MRRRPRRGRARRPGPVERAVPAVRPPLVPGRRTAGRGDHCPHGDAELTGPHRRALLRIVTDTCVRLWRRVHMDLVRYAGCVCRPSC
ncbi:MULTISPECIES: putative leader peptide [Streptomyces]|uniref:putative leader peptide n=1 Tax=Streptomyces TaxID=1883 RepID=UPI0034085C05